MVNLFFSYSHRDEPLRDELEVHLSMLKRQGIIHTWHDRRIDAGKSFEHEISKHLESSNIILLLVSPYFLASDYCYDIEMTKALTMNDSGIAVVIPVILHPCDWHNAPFGKLVATPINGKPISKYTNQHEAFLDVTTAIRTVASKFNNTQPESANQILPSVDTSPSNNKVLPRSSNLRIKKEFTDQDRDAFIEDTFEYIANYFEGSLDELGKRNPEITFKFKRVDANHFIASIYKNGNNISSCKIWIGGLSSQSNEISYSTDINTSNSTLNDSLTIEDDGHTLALKAYGFMSMGSGAANNLTQEGAAEYYWERLISSLQR